MSQKKAKRVKAGLEQLRKISNKAYVMMESIILDHQKSAAKMYNSYLLLSSIGACLTGNFNLGLGLFGTFLLERYVSNTNGKNSGLYTGVVGTLRDKLGLAKPVNSPFDLISEEYDLGELKNNGAPEDEDLS